MVTRTSERLARGGCWRRAAALGLAAALSAGCGGGDRATDEPPVKPDAKPAAVAPAAAGKPDPALEQDLRDFEERAREALRDRDFSKARRILTVGLERAGAAGRIHELSRGRLLLVAAELERETSHEVEARRHLADAMAVFMVESHEVGRFGVHLAQARLEAMLGDYVAAGRALDEAAALLPGIEDAVLRGEFLVQTGRLASRRLRPDDARDAFLEAARTFAAAKKKAEHADVLLLLADEEDRLGQTSGAQRSLDKALKAFRDLGDKDGEVRALHRQAAIYEREGQHRRARTLLQQVQALYSALGRTSDAAKVTQHLGALPED
jgi:tetratricopeptide (TPR) repeat protein